jgi:hypothetical protein
VFHRVTLSGAILIELRLANEALFHRGIDRGPFRDFAAEIGQMIARGSRLA